MRLVRPSASSKQQFLHVKVVCKVSDSVAPADITMCPMATSIVETKRLNHLMKYRLLLKLT